MLLLLLGLIIPLTITIIYYRLGEPLGIAWGLAGMAYLIYFMGWLIQDAEGAFIAAILIYISVIYNVIHSRRD